MELDPGLRDACERLRVIEDDDDRLRLFREAAGKLDLGEADKYELGATAFAVARDDTADFAQRILSEGQEKDRMVRFLVFATGAIACRRSQDKALGEGMFELAGDEFTDVLLFKHFLALSLDDGRVKELKRGLRLERDFREQTKAHAGAAHLVARLIVQLRDCDKANIKDAELQEALDAVDEAIELRPGYAKFLATRAAVYRQLGRFAEARDDLLEAIRLEDRRSFDARERIDDYKRDLTMLGAYSNLDSIDDKVTTLEGRTQRTVERLRGAELSVITAVAFVAGIISLVQITLTNVTDRPLGESIAIVGSFGVVLFGAVAFGAWLLRRPWSE